MKFVFIAKHRNIWPVAWLCNAMGVSRSGFHAWLNRSPSVRSRSDEAVSQQVKASFRASDRTYGARRVWRDLLADVLEGVAGTQAGLLTPDATAQQLDLALRAVAAGLVIRSSRVAERSGFAPAEDAPLLTPREREILTLIGEGLSNKEMARRLTISVHTVKFHLEALFAKLDATSRAEAVAKGLRGGVIEL